MHIRAVPPLKIIGVASHFGIVVSIVIVVVAVAVAFACFNKQYILYIILLLREGTSASRSRLGNLLTLSQNSALA